MGGCQDWAKTPQQNGGPLGVGTKADATLSECSGASQALELEVTKRLPCLLHNIGRRANVEFILGRVSTQAS